MSPVCGVLMVAMDVRPPSVELAMPTVVQTGWESGLIVAGVSGLLGMLWPGRPATGLGIELGAVLMLASVTGMYAVALSVTSGRQAVAAASFISAVALGSTWRSIEIMLTLRRLSNNGNGSSVRPPGRSRT